MSKDMELPAVESLRQELQEVLKEKKHPFRWPVLTTIGGEGVPHSRIVVLRSVSRDFGIQVHTDRRSGKMRDLDESRKAAFLFFDAENQVQIRLEGLAQVATEETRLSVWHHLSSNARRQYQQVERPGVKLEALPEVNETLGDRYFTVLEFAPQLIDYLKISKAGQLRASYERREPAWQSCRVAP